MDNYTEKLIKNARSSLFDKVSDGEWTAVKFVIENIDDEFNINSKELKQALYKNILEAIEETPELDAATKLKVLELINVIFNEK